MNCIAGCLKELRIGEPQSHCNLTLFPLLDGKASTLEYLLLDESPVTPGGRLAPPSRRGRGDSPIRFGGSSDLPGGAMLIEDGI
jgi:hypothetical protein